MHMLQNTVKMDMFVFLYWMLKVMDRLKAIEVILVVESDRTLFTADLSS